MSIRNKTNKKYTETAFNTLVFFDDEESFLEEIYATVTHWDYFNDFLSSRRIKAHTIAFCGVVLAVERNLPVGYYASNPQIKACIKDYFGKDYNDVIAPLVKELEKYRNEYLSNK